MVENNIRSRCTAFYDALFMIALTVFGLFRCFKALERLGDRITGAAGPFFVAFAVILISLGTVCFFDVIMPSLRWPLLSGPFCALVATNLLMHYYYVVTVSPGFVEDPPREPQRSIFWAKRTGGGRWDDDVVITRVCGLCHSKQY